MKKLFALSFAFVAFACNNDENKNNDVLDSSDSYAISETDSLLNTETAITELRLVTDKAITKDQLVPVEEWKEGNKIESKFVVTPEFLRDYKSVIRFSFDSLRILDFGSYGSVVSSAGNGQTVLEGGDPDSEVAVIDVKKGTRTRLFFSGPSGMIKSGSWLNNNTVIFSGYFDEGTVNKIDTLFWIVNVDSMTFKKFRYGQ